MMKSKQIGLISLILFIFLTEGCFLLENLVDSKITFDKNSKVATGDMDDIYGGTGSSSMTLPPNNFRYPGLKFLAWNTEPDGTGKSFLDEADVIITGEDTLYAIWRKYLPGDRGPANGYIFYVNPIFDSSWWYLEANSSYLNPIQWAKIGDFFGARGELLGDGKQNTIDILAFDSGSNAATIVNNFSVTYDNTVFNDWYLPSVDELVIIEENQYEYYSFYWDIERNTFWSSTNGTTEYGWCVKLDSTSTEKDYALKSREYKILPIRQFK
ncbi:MAG: hypothetical protein B6229_05730 [Spirochaetaceae bacterium 4572_7]|nr:MAG: hypothetical protein B6229_05730 [Spirochaetaceae bacterium 4572_7]